MPDTPPRTRIRRVNGLPALIAIALLIVAVLAFTLTREDARLKPATGTARAMALAAEGGEGATQRPRN